MYSPSPSATMITFSSSSLFSSSSSPRSDPSFVVGRCFLKRCTRNCVPLESTRSPLQLPTESAELAQQHSAKQCVRNLIRARDTVLVTSESNPPGDIFTLSTVLKIVEISMIIIFLTVSPPNCAISSSWSSLHVMTQLASSSMGQATLIALSCSSSFFTVFLKIHRHSVIALDRCDWPRTFSTSRAVGPSPSRNFVKHVIFSRVVALCARSGLSVRTI